MSANVDRKRRPRPKVSCCFTQEEFDKLWTPLGVAPEELAKAALRAPAEPRKR